VLPFWQRVDGVDMDKPRCSHTPGSNCRARVGGLARDLCFDELDSLGLERVQGVVKQRGVKAPMALVTARAIQSTSGKPRPGSPGKFARSLP
jgi:hypothetical protein